MRMETNTGRRQHASELNRQLARSFARKPVHRDLALIELFILDPGVSLIERGLHPAPNLQNPRTRQSAGAQS